MSSNGPAVRRVLRRRSRQADLPHALESAAYAISSPAGEKTGDSSRPRESVSWSSLGARGFRHAAGIRGRRGFGVERLSDLRSDFARSRSSARVPSRGIDAEGVERPGWSGQVPPLGLVVKDGGEAVGNGRGGEGSPARQHFVDEAAERPEIRPGVDGLGSCLLGAHVGGRSQDRAGGRHRDRRASAARTRRDGLGEAEVEDLRPALGRHANVRGFEVAMNHALFVGGSEGVGDLCREVEGLRLDLERAASEPECPAIRPRRAPEPGSGCRRALEAVDLSRCRDG